MAQDKMKAIIDQAEQDLLHTYNRYQIVLDRGEGSYLYDVNGKKYLDFMAGIAVFAFGYNHKKFNDAVKAQLDKIVHTSNYFYNEPSARAAHRIKEISGMDRVFFTNSGPTTRSLPWSILSTDVPTAPFPLPATPITGSPSVPCPVKSSLQTSTIRTA